MILGRFQISAVPNAKRTRVTIKFPEAEVIA
jgi:hypothetical protein